MWFHLIIIKESLYKKILKNALLVIFEKINSYFNKKLQKIKYFKILKYLFNSID